MLINDDITNDNAVAQDAAPEQGTPKRYEQCKTNDPTRCYSDKVLLAMSEYERELADLRRQLAEKDEELSQLLAQWNEIVSASGSKTHGGAIGHVASLVRQLAEAEDDVTRLHRDKMDLWQAINFPGGFKEQLHRAEAEARRYAELLDRAKREIKSYLRAGWIMGGGSVQEAHLFIDLIDKARREKP